MNTLEVYNYSRVGEQMEKIFSYNEDIDKTAYMNWRTRQHQPIHDMMIIADGYMKAAIMLAQDCLQDNGDKKADIVVFQCCFRQTMQ